MLRIVLTGGPSSGKTAMQRALVYKFGETLVLVPEAATILLSGGFPAPGRDRSWSQAWQDSFQQAVNK